MSFLPLKCNRTCMKNAMRSGTDPITARSNCDGCNPEWIALNRADAA